MAEAARRQRPGLGQHLVGRERAPGDLVAGREAAVGARRDALVRQVQRREEANRAAEAADRQLVGGDGDATGPVAGSPARKARRPASTASRKAAAIAAGSPAVPMAVLTRTASAPSSIASAACDGAPRPASTTTGTSDCSTMISSAA